ncbi:MFS transporter [Novosphingobium sp. FSY-8]|uniref:MFS transporter n=2 Tax=Novosphingobium ovatum TaxID=1908523 RepID=A0ABW9XA68_9SPHN|nr:MFS transporter [Novosphingobium ovatum]
MPGDRQPAKPADSPSAPGLPWGSLLLVLTIVFINFAGFSLIIPLLPFYGAALGASPVQITLLFAAYSLGGVFGETQWGRLSDRVGRRPVLIGATACAALSYGAFAYAPDLYSALAIRVATGFFSGVMGVCAAYVADVTQPQQRARAMGLIGAALNLGFAIGPAMGGLLATPADGLAGFRLPILVSGAVALGASAWSVFVLRESHPPGAVRPATDFGAGFRVVGASPLLARLFAITFIGIGTFAGMEAVYGLWTARNFGWTTHEVGLAFIAVGVAGFTVQVTAIGPATRRWGEARVIIAGLCVLAASMALMPVLRAPWAAVALMASLMMGHSIAFPSAGGLISRNTPPAMQGAVNGLSMATNALGRICLPPLFGAIYAIAPDAPYAAATALVALAVVIAAQVWRLTSSNQKAGS